MNLSSKSSNLYFPDNSNLVTSVFSDPALEEGHPEENKQDYFDCFNHISKNKFIDGFQLSHGIIDTFPSILISVRMNASVLPKLMSIRSRLPMVTQC